MEHVLAQGMQYVWPGGDEMEKELIKVVFLGYQERVDGTSFLLVNEVEGRSTVKFDKQKHELVEKEE